MIWKQVSNEKTTTKCGIMNNGLRANKAGIAWQCAGKIDSKAEIGHHLGPVGESGGSASPGSCRRSRRGSTS